MVDTQGGGNNGTPQPGQIAVYNAADFSIDESLNLIGSPAVFTFSPDSLYGYASGNGASNVQFYNLTTGLETASIGITSDAQQLFVDNSGKYLWVETNNGTTEVFPTGRVAVPEPASAAVLLFGAAGLGRRRRAFKQPARFQ